MRELMNITGALADESRVRALLALRGGELCACQVIELLGLAGSTVSRHLAVLHQAGLVQMRKEGRWVYYSLAGGDAPARVRSALKWIFQAAGEEARVAEDERALARILKVDPVELCRRQCRR
ncbi:MAG: helix-turn-helix transcriptional regulator [Verrucomicrobiae bacterium]|nr:helix-turn-helix transcriptional regulator [Verrucomicrobiae bacterium]